MKTDMIQDELFEKLVAMLPVENTKAECFLDFLKNKLEEFYGYVKDIEGIDEAVKQNVNSICNDINKIIEDQYKGLHSKAFEELSNLLDKTPDGKALIKKSTLEAHTSLYRARVRSGFKKFTYKDMFHIPFDKRGIVQTQRYSFPGYPCLYVGESIYSCWEEMHRVDFDLCMISRLENQKEVTLLDMRIPEKADFDNDIVATLYSFPLLLSCMAMVNNREDVFKPEYIVPQLLTEWLITHNDKSVEKIYGIRYTSSLQTGEFEFPKSKLNNIALFPLDGLETNGKYCSELSEIFRITNPTCNEFEKLKCGYSIDCGSCDDLDYDRTREENYKTSDFGNLEKRLNPKLNEREEIEKVKNNFPLHKMSDN